MTDEERAATLAEIEVFYARLESALNHHSPWESYVETTLKEEKWYRSIPRSTEPKMTAQQSTRLLCCQRVLRHAYELEDSTHLHRYDCYKKSEYEAYAIAVTGRELIKAAFTKEEAVKAQSWDYADLMAP